MKNWHENPKWNDFYILKLLNIKEEGKSQELLLEVNKDDFDFYHLENPVNIMMTELIIFESLLKSKHYESISSLYLKNNNNNLFNKSYTSFDFLSDKQEKHIMFVVDEINNSHKNNIFKYKEEREIVVWIKMK